MALKEIKMYTLICDKCGKDVCNGSEYSGWSEDFWVKDIAIEEGWIVINHDDYCPNCWEHNIEKENQILKNK